MAFINLNTVSLKHFHEDIVNLWLAAYGQEADPTPPEELKALYPTLLKQSEFPDFLAVAHVTNGKLVALSTGWPLNEGLRVRLATCLGDKSEWLQNSFYLSGLAVLPDFQGQGIARDLMGSLFSQTTCTRGVLTTYLTENRAVQIYEKSGWQNLSMNYLALNKLTYRVMGKSLS